MGGAEAGASSSCGQYSTCYLRHEALKSTLICRNEQVRVFRNGKEHYYNILVALQAAVKCTGAEVGEKVGNLAAHSTDLLCAILCM